MGYIPIFLDVRGRRCLVVGGGEVAARKIASLLEAGADVAVVSKAVNDDVASLVQDPRVTHIARDYASGDMDGATLIYAATDDAQLHRALFEEARQLGIPINVADVPELCTFISPAVLTRGSLKIAISTGGASPAMAKRILARLEGLFGNEYGLALEVMRSARRHLKSVEPDIRKRASKLTALAASRLPRHLREGDIDAVNKILLRHIGAGLDALGLAGNIKDVSRDQTSSAR